MMRLIGRWWQIICLSWFWPVAVRAEEITQSAGVTTLRPFDSAVLVKTVLTLGFVLALILLIAWLMKRLNATRFIGHSNMRVVSSLAVGSQEQVMLVQVGDKHLLLGVSSAGINALHAFDEAPFVIDESEDKTKPFSGILKTALGKK